MRNDALDKTLSRLVTQFNLDSEPYFQGKLQWVVTAKQRGPAPLFVRVWEVSTGMKTTLLTLVPERVGFLATMAFCDMMKKLLSTPPEKDIVGEKKEKRS